MIHRTLFVAAIGAAVVSSSHGDIIAQWDFNAQSLAPSAGAGTLSTVGGVSGGSFNQAAGSSDPLQPGFGWQTSGYPSQGQASGTAGIEIRLSTIGWDSISVNWDQRHSNASSRWTQFQYSWDGGANFIALDAFEATAGDTWFNDRSVNLAGLPGVGQNSEVVFRIVSIFQPGTLSYQAANSGSNYTGGTWRFDMITVEGVMSPVPAPGALAALGLAGLARGGRRRRA